MKSIFLFLFFWMENQIRFIDDFVRQISLLVEEFMKKHYPKLLTGYYQIKSQYEKQSNRNLTQNYLFCFV
ncbi:hypothetical protein DERP_002082 [Dermatophagoides pteronyssinus]|uniref:Uncharacterized protein n=1 Tax=Dermatophagoides pteronyssinus TaxID=6956 RepID=A0ABQ8JGR6_DERPT|nr:hypothetical protein DERP_002082 [Dermatophagoides pteronyssinus]